jgi:hypothetical protein
MLLEAQITQEKRSNPFFLHSSKAFEKLPRGRGGEKSVRKQLLTASDFDSSNKKKVHFLV